MKEAWNEPGEAAGWGTQEEPPGESQAAQNQNEGAMVEPYVGVCGVGTCVRSPEAWAAERWRKITQPGLRAWAGGQRAGERQ